MRSNSIVATGLLVCAGFALAACRDDDDDDGGGDEASATEASSAATTGDGDGNGDGDGDGDGDDEIVGLDLMTHLAGLWSGPATMTPLGTFETMNMDLRAVADDHVLFSRVDLDASNSLRFAFSIETIGVQDRLVYRNGGYFNGTLRDMRTIVESHTPLDANGVGSWRFCAISGGCDYIDATFEFQSATELVFDVKVQGQQHVLWIADRLEARTLPDPFPADESSQGIGNEPEFPAMPSLVVDISWADPLLMPADVWLLLSTQACPLMGFCEFSRSLRATADVGATSLELTIDQVHAGQYLGNAILDRDQNLVESLFPGDGDAVSLPNQPVEIAETGTSMTSLFVLVEL
jgi:hypothetical protein